MIPTLNVGDLIVVQGRLNFSELAVGYQNSEVPGEIIVYQIPPEFQHMFRDPNELIVHRAVDKEDIYGNNTWYFYTKGDASGGTGHDPWNPIRQDYIIGKVVGVIPWIGNVPLFIRTPTGIVFMVLLFILILLIEYVPSFFKKEEQEQKPPTSQKQSVWRIH
jgi:hypothetical protein